MQINSMSLHDVTPEELAQMLIEESPKLVGSHFPVRCLLLFVLCSGLQPSPYKARNPAEFLPGIPVSFPKLGRAENVAACLVGLDLRPLFYS